MTRFTFIFAGPLISATVTASPHATAGPMYNCFDDGYGDINCRDMEGGGSYHQSTSCSPTGDCSTTWIETPGFGPNY